MVRVTVIGGVSRPYANMDFALAIEALFSFNTLIIHSVQLAVGKTEMKNE